MDQIMASFRSADEKLPGPKPLIDARLNCWIGWNPLTQSLRS